MSESSPTDMSPAPRNIFSAILSYRSIADSLPKYLSIVVSHGRGSALVLAASYIVLITLWLPLWMLSYLFTESGVYFGIIIMSYKIGRAVVRLIAFPGASQRVYGEIENEFAKYAVRLLESTTSACAETANLILSSQKSSIGSNIRNVNDTIQANNFGVLTITLTKEFETSWSRTCFYRDRVFGMFIDVLHCLLNEEGNSANTTDGGDSVKAIESTRTRHGNNRLAGDIGNLSGLTAQARQDGLALSDLLLRIISDLKDLEGFYAQSNDGSGTLTADEEIVNIARKLLLTTKELQDLLTVLKPSQNSSSDISDLDDAAENGTHQNSMDTMSTYEVIKSSLGSVLPMLDPPPHSSIFGLDVLRGCVLSRYKGSNQLWIRRPRAKGMIDALHIPCPQKKSKKRTVLYCNPNAGYYEVATGMSFFGGNIDDHKEAVNCDGALHSSNDEILCWTDFYLKNGYDVYLFNYAGYGRSYGSGFFGGKPPKPSESKGVLGKLWRITRSFLFDFTPSPSTLKEDALTVARYLTETLAVDSLIIHGESIGGMAAASTAKQLSKRQNRDRGSSFNLLARTDSNDIILVCDRTFSNIIAVAQRLVGGWTGTAIRALVPFWNTDVAGDFLAASCPKIVCNDAADSVIADTSSLKSGIAEAKEMKKGSTKGVGVMRDAPLEYRMADFEGVGMQETKFATSASRRVTPPVWPVDKHIHDQEAYHFASCVIRIGKLASAARKAERLQSLHAVKSSDDDDNINEGVEMTAKSLSRVTIQSYINDDSDEENSDKEDQPVLIHSSRKSDKSVLMDVWNLLACCDGLCGAHLGFAVKGGHDCVVSWLCSVVTYGCQRVAGTAERRMGFPKSTDKFGETCVTAITSDYDCKSDAYYEEEDNDIQLTPIPLPKVLQDLQKIFAEHCGKIDGALTYLESELRYCIDMLEYIYKRTSSKLLMTSALESLHFQNAKENTCVGSFLNLHCGHNNMLSPLEQSNLSSLLKEIDGDDEQLGV